MAEANPKIAWKRAELAVNRFRKTAETDVARLNQFKKNILEYEKSGDRTSVRTELSRAQQTIYQLRSNLESIQKIRKDIKETDMIKFDTKMTQIRMEIMEDINNFAQLDSAHIEFLGEDFSDLLKTGLGEKEESPQPQIQTQKEEDVKTAQLTAELTVAEHQEEQIVQLAEDVSCAKDIMTTLNSMVQEQGETINSIESNVETAHENVNEGGLQLNKAVALKTAGFAVFGAIAGTLVGGPIGFFAGAKIGALAAGTGMVVGAATGNQIKNMQREANETEMQNLNVAADVEDTKSLRAAVVKSSTSKDSQDSHSQDSHSQDSGRDPND